MRTASGRRLLGLTLCGICVASCAGRGTGPPLVPAQEIPSQRIHIGMREELVLERLGPPLRTVGEKRYADGVMEVRHYVVNRINYLEETASKKEFYLYFWDRHLVRWDRPDEWEAEADRIHDSQRRK